MFSGFQNQHQSVFPSTPQGWPPQVQDHLQDPTQQSPFGVHQPVFGQTSPLGTFSGFGGSGMFGQQQPEELTPAKRKKPESEGPEMPPKRVRRFSGGRDSRQEARRKKKPPPKPNKTPPQQPEHIFGSSSFSDPPSFNFGQQSPFGFGQQSPFGFGQQSPFGFGQQSPPIFGGSPTNKGQGFESSLFNTWREPTKDWKQETPSWSLPEQPWFDAPIDNPKEEIGMEMEMNSLISKLQGLKLESLEIATVEFDPSEQLASFLQELPPGRHDIHLGQEPQLSVEQTVAAILEHHGGYLDGRQLHLPSLDPMGLSAATSGDALAQAVQGQLGPVDVALEVGQDGEAALFAQVNPRAKVAKITNKKDLSRAQMEKGWIMGNESEYQEKVGIRGASGEVIDDVSPFETMRHVMEVYRSQQLNSVRDKKKLALGDTIKDQQGNIVIGNIQVSGAKKEQDGFGETKVFQRPVHSGDWLAIYSSGEGAKGVTGDKLKLPRGFATKDDVDHFSVQKYGTKPNKPTQKKHDTFQQFLGGKSAKVIGVNPRWEEQQNGAMSLSIESKDKMTTKLGTKQAVKDRPSDSVEDMYPDRKVKYDASADAHSEAALWQTFQANDTEIAAWIDNLPIDQIWHLVVNIESEREMCGGCSAKSNTMLAQLDKFAPKVHQALTAKNIKFKPETNVDAFLKFESGGPCSLNDHNSPHDHGFGNAIENKDSRRFLGLEKPVFDETFEEDPQKWRSTTRMKKPPTVESVTLDDSTVDPNVTPLDSKKKAFLFGSQKTNVKDGKMDGDWSDL